MEKINVKALAVGLGVLWGVLMLFAGWVSIFGWATKFVEVMASIYIGFKPTFLGGVIGAIWGFIDGAISGAIIALVYNAIARKKEEKKR
ncbi:membrane-associated protein [bacterium]|nr:membrane-associated protein [bacterium]NIO19030.1 membrane-associated protein [bacterium]NIO74159.1 membrane-associated protein [bacterium]